MDFPPVAFHICFSWGLVITSHTRAMEKTIGWKHQTFYGQIDFAPRYTVKYTSVVQHDCVGMNTVNVRFRSSDFTNLGATRNNHTWSNLKLGGAAVQMWWYIHPLTMPSHKNLPPIISEPGLFVTLTFPTAYFLPQKTSHPIWTRFGCFIHDVSLFVLHITFLTAYALRQKTSHRLPCGGTIIHWHQPSHKKTSHPLSFEFGLLFCPFTHNLPLHTPTP